MIKLKMCVRKLNLMLCNIFNKFLQRTIEFLRFYFYFNWFHLSKQTSCANGLKNRYKKTNELRIQKVIPEIKGWPIFGTLFDLIAAGGSRHLHLYIDRRHRELGTIFQERLGLSGNAYVFVSSASQLRSVFLFEGQYPRHPLPESWQLYNQKFECQRGLFFMENIEWLHNRRILNRFLLNGKLNWMDTHIEASTMKLINEWKGKLPAQIQKSNGGFIVKGLEQRLYRWAVDVICTIMFGQIVMDYPEIEQLLDAFSKIVQNIFEKSTALMDFPPKLAKLLHLHIWQDFEESVTNVLNMGALVIDKLIELLKENAMSHDFNKIHDNDSLFQRLLAAKLTLPMIKRIFVDLVIAAGDTTAYTSIWALYILTQNEKMQDQLFDDLLLHGEESQLINGLIKETLRLYPVAPFIGRFLDTDAEIDGYHIKRNTLVLLSLYTAGRDAAHFPDPLCIQPERWLRNGNGDFNNVQQAHGSLPFAIGNRSCIGRKVAMKQIQCLLRAIISNFKIHCGNIQTLEPILRLVTVPNQNLQLVLKCR